MKRFLKRAWGWLIGGMVLVLLVVALDVTGGLDRDLRSAGRDMAVGEPVAGRRWTLTVLEASIVNDFDDQPKLEIAVEGRFDGEEALANPSEGVVVLQGPDGTFTTKIDWLGDVGFGQPGVQDSAVASARLEEFMDPKEAADGLPVSVVICDEAKIDSFIQGERWVGGADIGRVALKAKDMRGLS